MGQNPLHRASDHRRSWPPHLQGEAEQHLRLLVEGGWGEGRNHLSFQKIPASQRQEPA